MFVNKAKLQETAITIQFVGSKIIEQLISLIRLLVALLKQYLAFSLLKLIY